jgi:ABC-2 type transport system ATP-binding protein
MSRNGLIDGVRASAAQLMPTLTGIDLLPAPEHAPAVRVEHLTKRYGHRHGIVQAASDISLSVGPGQTLALLGHNGAGKSTLIRCIATLSRPDAGRILIHGGDIVADPSRARMLLGVSLQDTGVPRRQCARRLIGYHGRLHGLSVGAARLRTRELVESFDLTSVADRPVATYSGGERRRLDLALVLVHRPAVLLLDEPTTSLDIASRQAIWAHLNAQLREGTTLIFSTHDLHEADEQADRLAILDHGALVASNTTGALKRRFATQRLSISFSDAAESARAMAILGPAAEEQALQLKVSVEQFGDAIALLDRLRAHDLRPSEISLSEPSLTSVVEHVLGSPNPTRAPQAPST